jgi:hypothetical protein
MWDIYEHNSLVKKLPKIPNEILKRAKVLARALKCHPAVLVFPGWEIKDSEAA